MWPGNAALKMCQVIFQLGSCGIGAKEFATLNARTVVPNLFL